MMRPRSLFTMVLAAICIFIIDDADAQRRNKYQKRRAKNKQISKYRGGRIAASRFRPYSFLGVSVNTANYFGDLAPVNKAASTDISFTRPGFGAFWGRKFHHSLAFRAAFNYARLKGDDVTADPTAIADRARYLRNLSFRNDIKELSATIQVDFLPNYGGPQSRLLVNAYFFAGVAAIHHEPRGIVPELEYQTDYNNPVSVPEAGQWVKLRALGTEGQNFGLGKKYSPIEIAIPFGFGGDLFVNQQLNIGLEMGVRWLFMDYLDDVSGSYVDLDIFEDNHIARILSDRSLERVTAWTGVDRSTAFDSSNPEILVNLSPSQKTYDSGNSYWVSSSLGSGQSSTEQARSIRGNPNDNDLYFMTRIRITYVLGNNGQAKFR